MFDSLGKSLQQAFSKVQRSLNDTDDLSKARAPATSIQCNSRACGPRPGPGCPGCRECHKPYVH